MFTKVRTATVFTRKLREDHGMEENITGTGSVFPQKKHQAHLEEAFDRRKTAVMKATQYLTDKEESGADWNAARRKLEVLRARQYIESRSIQRQQDLWEKEKEAEKMALYERQKQEKERVERERKAVERRERMRQQELDLQRQRELLMIERDYNDEGLVWPPQPPPNLRRHPRTFYRDEIVESELKGSDDEESPTHKPKLTERSDSLTEKKGEEGEEEIMSHLQRARMRSEGRTAGLQSCKPNGRKLKKFPDTTTNIQGMMAEVTTITSQLQPPRPQGYKSVAEVHTERSDRGSKDKGKGRGSPSGNPKFEVHEYDRSPTFGSRKLRMQLESSLKEIVGHDGTSHKHQRSESHKEQRTDHHQDAQYGGDEDGMTLGVIIGQSDLERGYLHHMKKDGSRGVLREANTESYAKREGFQRSASMKENKKVSVNPNTSMSQYYAREKGPEDEVEHSGGLSVPRRDWVRRASSPEAIGSQMVELQKPDMLETQLEALSVQFCANRKKSHPDISESLRQEGKGSEKEEPILGHLSRSGSKQQEHARKARSAERTSSLKREGKVMPQETKLSEECKTESSPKYSKDTPGLSEKEHSDRPENFRSRRVREREAFLYRDTGDANKRDSTKKRPDISRPLQGSSVHFVSPGPQSPEQSDGVKLVFEVKKFLQSRPEIGGHGDSGEKPATTLEPPKRPERRIRSRQSSQEDKASVRLRSPTGEKTKEEVLTSPTRPPRRARSRDPSREDPRRGESREVLQKAHTLEATQSGKACSSRGTSKEHCAEPRKQESRQDTQQNDNKEEFRKAQSKETKARRKTPTRIDKLSKADVNEKLSVHYSTNIYEHKAQRREKPDITEHPKRPERRQRDRSREHHRTQAIATSKPEGAASQDQDKEALPVKPERRLRRLDLKTEGAAVQSLRSPVSPLSPYEDKTSNVQYSSLQSSPSPVSGPRSMLHEKESLSTGKRAVNVNQWSPRLKDKHQMGGSPGDKKNVTFQNTQESEAEEHPSRWSPGETYGKRTPGELQGWTHHRNGPQSKTQAHKTHEITQSNKQPKQSKEPIWDFRRTVETKEVVIGCTSEPTSPSRPERRSRERKRTVVIVKGKTKDPLCKVEKVDNRFSGLEPIIPQNQQDFPKRPPRRSKSRDAMNEKTSLKKGKDSLNEMRKGGLTKRIPVVKQTLHNLPRVTVTLAPVTTVNPIIKPPYALWGEGGWLRTGRDKSPHHPHFPHHHPAQGLAGEEEDPPTTIFDTLDPRTIQIQPESVPHVNYVCVPPNDQILVPKALEETDFECVVLHIEEDGDLPRVTNHSVMPGKTFLKTSKVQTKLLNLPGSITVAEDGVPPPKEDSVTLPKDGVPQIKKDIVTLHEDGVPPTKEDSVTLPEDGVPPTKEDSVTFPEDGFPPTKEDSVTLPEDDVPPHKEDSVTLLQGGVPATKQDGVILPQGSVPETKEDSVTLLQDGVPPHQRGQCHTPSRWCSSNQREQCHTP